MNRPAKWPALGALIAATAFAAPAQAADVYSYYNPTTHTHLLRQGVAITSPLGYQSPPVKVGTPASAANGLKIWVLRKAATMQFNYTNSAAERDALIATGDWALWADLAYTVPEGTPGAKPIFRMEDPATGDVGLTIDDYDRRRAIESFGWQETGQLGYLVDEPALWTGTPFRAKAVGLNPGLVPQADPLNAPFTRISCATNDYAVQPQPDGSTIIEVHQGDHPAEDPVQKTRCFHTNHDDSINGRGGYPNAETRFYRFDVGVPSDYVRPNTTGFQTLAEWHGIISGRSGQKIAITGTPDKPKIELTTHEKINGVDQPDEHWDSHFLARDQWYSYVLELLSSPDPAIGYFRLYRDGVCRTCGDPRADAEGKVFRRTARTGSDGTIDHHAFSAGFYRDPLITTVGKSMWRDVKIGRALAEVLP